MIKAVTSVRFSKNKRDFEALNSLFSALGFEPGTEWKSAKGQGRYFLAPVAKLELVLNQKLPSDLWVEVTDLDTIRNLLKQHKVKLLSDIKDTGWGSRALVAGPAKDLKIAFWQTLEPREDAIEGELNASGMRFGIVVSRWNSFITERLLQGALDCLRRSGAKSSDIQIARVPGSFEIPSAARLLAQSGTVDAIVALGCLIRGETTHYEHIATEVTRGIGQSAQETGVPHSYGVLTCENLEQAIDRAGLKSGNKGWEAAMTAIEMVSLKGKLKRGASDGC